MIQDLIRNQDLFGHNINLSFENQSGMFKTYYGGLASICVKAFLTVYFVLNVILVTSHQANQYSWNEK